MPINLKKEKAKVPLYLEVRERWLNGETCRELAKDYNKTPQWVSNIIRGRLQVLKGYPSLPRLGRQKAVVANWLK